MLTLPHHSQLPGAAVPRGGAGREGAARRWRRNGAWRWRSCLARQQAPTTQPPRSGGRCCPITQPSKPTLACPPRRSTLHAALATLPVDPCRPATVPPCLRAGRRATQFAHARLRVPLSSGGAAAPPARPHGPFTSSTQTARGGCRHAWGRARAGWRGAAPPTCAPAAPAHGDNGNSAGYSGRQPHATSQRLGRARIAGSTRTAAQSAARCGPPRGARAGPPPARLASSSWAGRGLVGGGPQAGGRAAGERAHGRDPRGEWAAPVGRLRGVVHGLDLIVIRLEGFAPAGLDSHGPCGHARAGRWALRSSAGAGASPKGGGARAAGRAAAHGQRCCCRLRRACRLPAQRIITQPLPSGQKENLTTQDKRLLRLPKTT